MFTQAKFLQTNLCERFTTVSSSRAVEICSLGKEKPYTVIGAERLPTKYGTAILLTIQAPAEDAVRVFLSKRFTHVFQDEDIDMINVGMIKMDFIYYGVCDKTSAYQFSLLKV